MLLQFTQTFVLLGFHKQGLKILSSLGEKVKTGFLIIVLWMVQGTYDNKRLTVFKLTICLWHYSNVLHDTKIKEHVISIALDHHSLFRFVG